MLVIVLSIWLGSRGGSADAKTRRRLSERLPIWIDAPMETPNVPPSDRVVYSKAVALGYER